MFSISLLQSSMFSSAPYFILRSSLSTTLNPSVWTWVRPTPGFHAPLYFSDIMYMKKIHQSAGEVLNWALSLFNTHKLIRSAGALICSSPSAQHFPPCKCLWPWPRLHLRFEGLAPCWLTACRWLPSSPYLFVYCASNSLCLTSSSTSPITTVGVN